MPRVWRLRKVHVRNFFSIREAELEVNPLNFLAGVNGSGKSNLFRAIMFATHGGRMADPLSLELLRRFYALGFLPRVFDYRDAISPFGQQEPIKIILDFDKGRLECEIIAGASGIVRNERLHYNGQLLAEKVSGTVEFSGQRYVSKPYLSILETEALSAYSRAIRDSIVFLDPIAVDSLPVDAETAKQVLESKAPQKTVKRMLSEEKLDLARAGLLLLVLSSREKEYFLEIVRKAFDSLKILDISLRQWHSSVHIVARETIGDRVVDVPYPRFPDGLKCFMFLYGALVQAPRGATIMIEEPEVHLHVTAIHSVMNLFRRHVEDRKLQFLVSTHSPDLIEIAYPDEVVRVERTVSGASLYSPLSSEEGHEDTMRYLAGMPR